MSTIQTPALLAQIQHGVQLLDTQAGRSWDGKSENMSIALHALAVEKGFARVDHVLIGGRGLAAQAGENVFIVQGDPKDPAHLRASLKTLDAISAPVPGSQPAAQQIDTPAAAMAAPTLDVPVQAPPPPRLG